LRYTIIMAMNKKIVISLLLVIVASVAGASLVLWQHQHVRTAKVAKSIQGKQLYTCSMHTFIIRDKPGVCPICGMELIKKIDTTTGGSAQIVKQKQQPQIVSRQISLSSSQRIMANVATVEAKNETLNKEINAVGIVQFDQSRQAKVTAWVAGRIDRLNVNTVGTMVTKDKPIAEIYSPDLVAAQQEYLLAIKSRNQLKSSPFTTISEDGEGLVASSKQRLMLFGVKEREITALEKSGRINFRIPIYTPLSGVVIEKMVQQGQYVNVGEVLFNIADLSTVWIEVEVYENEFSNIHIGQQVEIRSQSFPEKVFTGRLSFIYPFLDPKTRTVRVRVEMANTGTMLKPDMFVNATIKVPLTSSIVVPVTALMDTGKRQVVWIESSPGIFEARDVHVGQHMHDKVQILSGINPGDKVAVSGGYLIDSESQLK